MNLAILTILIVVTEGKARGTTPSVASQCFSPGYPAPQVIRDDNKGHQLRYSSVPRSAAIQVFRFVSPRSLSYVFHVPYGCSLKLEKLTMTVFGLCSVSVILRPSQHSPVTKGLFNAPLAQCDNPVRGCSGSIGLSEVGSTNVRGRQVGDVATLTVQLQASATCRVRCAVQSDGQITPVMSVDWKDINECRTPGLLGARCTGSACVNNMGSFQCLAKEITVIPATSPEGATRLGRSNTSQSSSTRNIVEDAQLHTSMVPARTSELVTTSFQSAALTTIADTTVGAAANPVVLLAASVSGAIVGTAILFSITFLVLRKTCPSRNADPTGDVHLRHGANPPDTIDRYTSSGRRKILAQPQVSNLELKASPPNPVVPHSESAVLRSSCAWHVEPTECRAYGCTSQQAEEAIYCEIH
eukprot:scpid57439/ scgid2880/ 